MFGYDTGYLAFLLVLGFWAFVVLVAFVPAGLAAVISMIFGLELAYGAWLICCAWAIIVIAGAALWWFVP